MLWHCASTIEAFVSRQVPSLQLLGTAQECEHPRLQGKHLHQCRICTHPLGMTAVLINDLCIPMLTEGECISVRNWHLYMLACKLLPAPLYI